MSKAKFERNKQVRVVNDRSCLVVPAKKAAERFRLRHFIDTDRRDLGLNDPAKLADRVHPAAPAQGERFVIRPVAGN